MPIRDENKARYPADWKAISRRIRDLAGQVCQQCGAPNGEMIRRGVSEAGTPLWRHVSASAYEDGFHADHGHQIPDTGEDTVNWGKPVRVILTTAHLDHTPENCSDCNLRAWCQRCHNVYDGPMRKRGIAARAKAVKAAGDLFA